MRPRALVTGGGIRVGRAIALELAGAGHDVAIHYRHNDKAARAVAEEAAALGVDSFVVGADLQEVAGCTAVVDRIKERWDTLSVLVNNASIFAPAPFAELALADWERMQAINLRAPFLLSQGLLPLLQAARGTVVHMCDIGADRPVSGYTHYSVSKAGLVMLVKAMAVELAPAVRTVGISPGQVAWPDDYDEDKRRRLSQRIPMGAAGAPRDVATLIRFLVTEATYLNGVVVPVDGGLSVRY